VVSTSPCPRAFCTGYRRSPGRCQSSRCRTKQWMRSPAGGAAPAAASRAQRCPGAVRRRAGSPTRRRIRRRAGRVSSRLKAADALVRGSYSPIHPRIGDKLRDGGTGVGASDEDSPLPYGACSPVPAFKAEMPSGLCQRVVAYEWQLEDTPSGLLTRESPRGIRSRLGSIRSLRCRPSALPTRQMAQIDHEFDQYESRRRSHRELC
jgi:hypothetical protein